MSHRSESFRHGSGDALPLSGAIKSEESLLRNIVSRERFQILTILKSQSCIFEEIRPVPPCLFQRHPPSPPSNLFMVPPGKGLRNRHPHKIRWSSVVRIVQQATCSIRRPRRSFRLFGYFRGILSAKALKT
jgi:hypothetical protein